MRLSQLSCFVGLALAVPHSPTMALPLSDNSDGARLAKRTFGPILAHWSAWKERLYDHWLHKSLGARSSLLKKELAKHNLRGIELSNAQSNVLGSDTSGLGVLSNVTAATGNFVGENTRPGAQNSIGSTSDQMTVAETGAGAGAGAGSSTSTGNNGLGLSNGTTAMTGLDTTKTASDTNTTSTTSSDTTAICSIMTIGGLSMAAGGSPGKTALTHACDQGAASTLGKKSGSIANDINDVNAQSSPQDGIATKSQDKQTGGQSTATSIANGVISSTTTSTLGPEQSVIPSPGVSGNETTGTPGPSTGKTDPNVKPNDVTENVVGGETQTTATSVPAQGSADFSGNASSANMTDSTTTTQTVAKTSEKGLIGTKTVDESSDCNCDTTDLDKGSPADPAPPKPSSAASNLKSKRWQAQGTSTGLRREWKTLVS